MRIPVFIQPKRLAPILGALVGVLTASPAWAAEKIQFFYGPFEPTIYIEDLETFVETGEVTERFELVANRLDQDQKENLRAFLNTRYDISAVSVSQFTYSPVGERLLQRMGQVVQTDSFLNGMKAIRAALIFAAADTERGCTIINVLRHFPLETIQLDIELTRQILAENQDIFQRRDQVVAEIRELATTQPTEDLGFPKDQDPQFAGPHRWQVETISFQNSGRERPSLANLYTPEIPNAPNNSIPVVAISHGIASSRETFGYLAEHLASHGYGVVVLEHAETSAERFTRFLNGLEGAPDPRELLLRPQDITTMLDTLSAQQDTNPKLRDLNLESVGLLGQSLGGYTVLAAGGAVINRPKLADQCLTTLAERPTLNLSMLLQCRILELPKETSLAVADSRVSAVIALNPLTSHIFGESGLQQIDVPVMLVAGTNDYFTPALPEQIEPFDWLTTNHRQLVVMENGTHFSFLGGSDRSVLPVPDGFIGPDPQQARPQVQAISLAFFNRYLKDQTEAEVFLHQAYLDEFPIEPFQFSLIDTSLE